MTILHLHTAAKIETDYTPPWLFNYCSESRLRILQIFGWLSFLCLAIFHFCYVVFYKDADIDVSKLTNKCFYTDLVCCNSYFFYIDLHQSFYNFLLRWTIFNFLQSIILLTLPWRRWYPKFVTSQCCSSTEYRSWCGSLSYAIPIPNSIL